MMRALIMVLLIIINVRDHETDSAPGIRTILAHFGRRAGWIEFTPMIVAAYSLPGR